MIDTPKPPDRTGFYKGILYPNIGALLLMLVFKSVDLMTGDVSRDFSTAAIFGSFFLIPIAMGVASAYFWKNMNLKLSAYIGWSCVNSLITIALSAVFLREGAFCLLIVSPLIFALNILGALAGRYMYRRNNQNLNVSFYGVMIVVVAADVLSDHEHNRMVSDELIVNAPIEKVWPLVVEYEPITAKEEYWMFKAGMPSPRQSTVSGHEAGAGRKCIFSNGYVFDEKMIVYKPNEELTFDIVTQPRDPEIMGHIDILRGQFLLKDNGDGTTTVTGNSWYRLYVFPAWYFDLWAESITRNVHLRVMHHIKDIAEQGV